MGVLYEYFTKNAITLVKSAEIADILQGLQAVTRSYSYFLET